MRNYKKREMNEFYKLLCENKRMLCIDAFYKFHNTDSINYKDALTVYTDFRKDEAIDFLKYFEEL